MPERNWKRPTLFVISALALIGVVYILSVIQRSHSLELWDLVLGGVLAPLFLLGVVVSMFGCNTCVSKMFGRVSD